MKPGRDLDALVAEEVMGCKTLHGFCCCEPGRTHGIAEWRTEVHIAYPLKSYSTDIAAAWEVVEKLGRDGYNTAVHKWSGNDHWTCEIEKMFLSDPAVVCGESATTAPHAICLAALKVARSIGTRKK